MVQICMSNCGTCASRPQERNESLFHYVLANNIEELLPIVHMPTVSLYCQKYGLMFKSLPRSLFISIKDKGARSLQSWRKCDSDGTLWQRTRTRNAGRGL